MSYLYAIQMLIPNYVNPVKIGLAVKPARRLASYSGEPFPVRCLGTWRGRREDERAAHRLLATHRMGGEWFYPAEDVLLFIQHKTGLINLSPRLPREFGPQSVRRALRAIADHPHANAVNDIIRKAREVMARYRTFNLTERQVAILLDLPFPVLNELKKEEKIHYTPDAKYALEDLVEFLTDHPSFAAAAVFNRDGREVDKRLYEIAA